MCMETRFIYQLGVITRVMYSGRSKAFNFDRALAVALQMTPCCSSMG